MQKITGSKFSEWYVTLNELKGSGFKSWSFLPGMLFGDLTMWWGNQGDRAKPHEGLDLAIFLDAEKREQQLTATMLVPPLFRGRVINIIDDLLGRTIIIEHPVNNGEGSTLNAFYAHLIPHRSVIKGKEFGPGETLGTIAPGSNNCPAHLHISTAWCSRETRLSNFSWNNQKDPTIKLFDPNVMIGATSTF